MDTKEAGRMGGKKVFKKYGRKYFSMLGKKSVEARRLTKKSKNGKG